MWASILAALGKLFYEIIKSESGPVVAVAAPIIPSDLRDQWDDWLRERLSRGVH